MRASSYWFAASILVAVVALTGRDAILTKSTIVNFQSSIFSFLLVLQTTAQPEVRCPSYIFAVGVGSGRSLN